MIVQSNSTFAHTNHEGNALPEESMEAVLGAIRRKLSLDSTKTSKQICKRMGDFATAVNHMAKSMGTTRRLLTVCDAVENEPAFVDYVARSKLSATSKAQLSANRNTVFQLARELGFSASSFQIRNEWEPTLAVIKRGSYSGASAIVGEAIRHKRHIGDFSQADLDAWAYATLNAGRSCAYVRQAQAAFCSAVRHSGLRNLLPQFDAAFRRPSDYRVRTKVMGSAVRAEIEAIVNSTPAQSALGANRPSPTSENDVRSCFEQFCGYAVRICGEEVTSLKPLLTESFVESFAFWLQDERGCKRSSVVGKLCRMFTALESTAEFGGDYSWRFNIYRKMLKEPESALKERRRKRHVRFQDLAAIPGRVAAGRSAQMDLPPVEAGWKIHDELLLSSLVLAQYPPHFVRGAVLGRHIFRGPIPEDGPPFNLPTWAAEMHRADASTSFWQFHFDGSDGRVFRGLILRQIVPLLELYVVRYRPLLLESCCDPGTVFLNRSGRPLTIHRLGQHVGNLTQQYTGKRVTPTAIRSSFAHYWREKHPGKDAMLANIQWVQYPTVKMRYDEEFRRQRLARVGRRKGYRA